MIGSNQSIKSQVIQAYLNGKTRDQIAQDAGISQGTVSGIIKELATRIGIPIAEQARDSRHSKKIKYRCQGMWRVKG